MIEKLPSVGSDTAMMASLVEVATVWVRHCFFKPEDLVATGILATTFQALNFDALFEPAAALVVELLERYNSHTRHAVVVNALIPGLMALVPKFNAAKAREEEDVEREYVRMFSAMGVSYVSLILDEVRGASRHSVGYACSRLLILGCGTWQASSNQMPLVTLLVKCTDSPNSLLSSPDICKSMFQFWFHLVDTFNHIKSKTHKQACRAMLAPAFSELVGVLLRVVRFPDEFDSLPADKQQEFIVDFRCVLIGALMAARALTRCRLRVHTCRWCAAWTCLTFSRIAVPCSGWGLCSTPSPPYCSAKWKSS